MGRISFQENLSISQERDVEKKKNASGCMGYLSFSRVKASLLNEKQHTSRTAGDSRRPVGWL